MPETRYLSTRQSLEEIAPELPPSRIFYCYVATDTTKHSTTLSFDRTAERPTSSFADEEAPHPIDLRTTAPHRAKPRGSAGHRPEMTLE
jgi:hypothetical protein